MNPTTWLAAFASMAALDVAWVLYMRAANKCEPVRAAAWAGALHAFSAISVLTYTHDARYLSATMLGTVLGTWGVVRWVKGKG